MAKHLKPQKSRIIDSQFQLSFSQMRKLKLLNDIENSNDFVSAANQKLDNLEKDLKNSSYRNNLNRACKTREEPSLFELPSYNRYTGT